MTITDETIDYVGILAKPRLSQEKRAAGKRRICQTCLIMSTN